jgi:hypothetical protein
MAKRLASKTAELTTATLTAMDRRHDWFAAMNPEHRSWITLVARAGIDRFVTWTDDSDDASPDPSDLFNAAPRQAARRISLHQTVELLRTTIEVVEQGLAAFPEPDRSLLQLAIVHYSREVAFGAAEIYAQAAEKRGDWDSRLEALVVDSVVRGDLDEDLLSRAAALGWSTAAGDAVHVAVGPLPADADIMADRLHGRAAQARLAALVSPLDDRLVAVVGGGLADDEAALKAFAELSDCFGDGPVVVGPRAFDLASAHLSARPALAGQKAAAMWPTAPRPVLAGDLLAERVLVGDESASDELAARVGADLARGGDLRLTLTAYFDEGGSVEATARRLFCHPNTVRYRLRRVTDLTGYDPGSPRDAFTLQTALKLSRLRAA